LFLHNDHLNFMLETRQRSVARAYLRGLNFECPREAGIEDFDLSLSDRCTKASYTRLCTKNLKISTFNFRVLASETDYSPHCAPRREARVARSAPRSPPDHRVSASLVFSCNSLTLQFYVTRNN
jgi:hypothetical protein